MRRIRIGLAVLTVGCKTEADDPEHDAPSLPNAHALFLNEIMVTPSQDELDGRSQWVEIFNAGQAAIDLSGFKLVNPKGSPLATLSGVIQGNSHATISLSPHALASVDGVALQKPDGSIGDYVAFGSPQALPTGSIHDAAVHAGHWPSDEVVNLGEAQLGEPIARWFDGYSTASAGDWHVVHTDYAYRGQAEPSPINTPALLPSPAVIISERRPEFQWERPDSIGAYTFELARDTAFSDVVLRQPGISSNAFVPAVDLPSELLFWRLIGETASGPTRPSAPWVLGVDGGDWQDVTPVGVLSSATPSPRPQASLTEAPSGVPFFWQRKDTSLLCLRRADLTEAGCDSGGPYGLNVPHPDQRPGIVASSPGHLHDLSNCARASTEMVNHYWGGDLSQDRIAAHVFTASGRSKYDRLGHAVGLSEIETTTALSWALGTPVAVVAGDGDTFEQVVKIGNGHPILAGIKPSGGGHMIVVLGVSLLGSPGGAHVKSILVHDPQLGPSRRLIVAWSKNEIEQEKYFTGWTFKVFFTYDAAAAAHGRRMQESSVSTDTDRDGVMDFDEERFGTDAKLSDSDGDGVGDFEELASHTFGRGIRSTPALSPPDGDGDGYAAELDCNADVPWGDGATHFDGAEDVNGDGFFGTLADWPTLALAPGEYDIYAAASSPTTLISVDKSTPYHAGDKVHVQGLAFHGDTTYTVYKVACDPLPAHNAALTTPVASFHTLASGNASPKLVQTVTCADVPGCYVLIADVLHNALYDHYHEAGPLPMARCTDPKAKVEIEGICGDGCLIPPEECESQADCPSEYNCIDCKCEYCGDGILQAGLEQCEPALGAGTCDGPDYLCANDCTCRLKVCGDSMIDTDEDCDPPTSPVSCEAMYNSGWCDETCHTAIATPTCGDGCLNHGEACEPGTAFGFGPVVCSAPDATCGDDCTCTINEGCGDVTDKGHCVGNILEWCDDGEIETQDCGATDQTCGCVVETGAYACLG